MNISKKSWHYKMNMFFSDQNEYRIPTSLCPYFWKTTFFVFMTAMAVSMLSLFSWAMGEGVFSWIMAYFGISLGAIASAVPSALIGAVLILTVFALIFGLFFGGGWVKNKIVDKFDEIKEQKEEERIKLGLPKKEPNLLISFIKAKKQKFCPNIDFV